MRGAGHCALLAGAACLTLAGGASAADEHHEEPEAESARVMNTSPEGGLAHTHASLPMLEALTLREALEAAVSRYPESAVLEARAGQADAWEARGRDWLAERPSLSLRYQTDRWMDNDRLDEYEAGVLLPLWSWGSRSATQAYGEALQAESGAASDSLRWEVAGYLRSTLWDIGLAQEELSLAKESLAIAQRVAATVSRRHELGDASLREVLMAQTAELEARSRLVTAEAAVVDAERNYRSLTGLDARPPFRGESLSVLQSVPPDHPALTFADAEIQRAESARALAQTRSAGSPSLLIGPRRERAADAEDFDDSIGVTLSVPFGPSAQRKTEVAAAQRDLASASATRARHVRALTLALHEAAHGLAIVRESLGPANEQAALAERQERMAMLAYEQGEIELIELIRLRGMALAAKRRQLHLAVEEKRQIAFYNQAVGELP